MADYNDPRYVLEKVTIDPDEFLGWSRVNAGGKVGHEARATFAAIVISQKHGTDH